MLWQFGRLQLVNVHHGSWPVAHRKVVKPRLEFARSHGEDAVVFAILSSSPCVEGLSGSPRISDRDSAALFVEFEQTVLMAGGKIVSVEISCSAGCDRQFCLERIFQCVADGGIGRLAGELCFHRISAHQYC